ncbi:MAG TPA: host attachment protein [Rhizomicrobium sp.]|nr:host attachment protein [Rhizomicrobium sp.]
MATFGRTLIVVLDDSRARFYRREASGELADGLPEVTSGIDAADAPAQRSAKRKDFLRTVMAALDEACDRSECDRLVAVGPERMLSAFRKASPDKVRVRLWREAAMEMDGLEKSELEQRLAPHFR